MLRIRFFSCLFFRLLSVFRSGSSLVLPARAHSVSVAAQALALTLMLTACGEQPAATPPATSAQVPIRMAVAQAPVNLDPRVATDAASERVNRLLYRPLVDFDAQSRPVPALANWVSVDATHYRFTLLPKTTGTLRAFHDGRPLSAHDVVATYRSLMGMAASPRSAEFANIQRVDAVDDDTVLFQLKQPDADFPARLVVGILPAALIQAGHDFARAPVGSGPLRFVSWQGALTLERLADQQRIQISEVKDPTVRVLKLLRGEVDLLQGDLPPELLRYLQGRPGIRVQSAPGANFSYLGFNFNDPVLQDLRVRQAIAHGVDVAAIVRQALVPGSRVAGAVLPPEHWAGNAGLAAYAYDPARALALLREAGVPLPLKLVYKTSTDAQRVRLATILQAQLKPAGIALEIRSLDWGTFFEDIKQGQFQLYGLTWVGLRTPEIYRLAFHSDSVPPRGANRGRYADPVLDGMISAADWPAVTQRLHAQLPYLPLWYEGQFAAMRTGLVEYSLRSDGHWDGLATINNLVLPALPAD